jgi:hypothetical protein
MASNLSRSRFRSPVDLVVLMQVLGWQAPGYEGWLHYGIGLLLNL